MPPAKFRGLRREIAISVRDRKRTLYEISKAVGRRPGDIQRSVRQMYAEDLLKADDPQPVRGTHFWFNEEHADALEAAAGSDRPVGQLVAEQRMLAIASPEHADLYSVLRRSELTTVVSWAAEWGGDGELLIGLVPGTTKQAADRLVAALRDAQVGCIQRRVGQLIGSDELRRLADGVKDAQQAVHT
jgi:hypothetical protein